MKIFCKALALAALVVRARLPVAVANSEHQQQDAIDNKNVINFFC
jgi:hypothetical protein